MSTVFGLILCSVRGISLASCTIIVSIVSRSPALCSTTVRYISIIISILARSRIGSSRRDSSSGREYSRNSSNSSCNDRIWQDSISTRYRVRI